MKSLGSFNIFSFFLGKWGYFMKYKIIYLVIFFVSLTSLNAQVIGKIFDKDYADREFGAVVTFVEIDNNELTDLLEFLQNKFINTYQRKYN